MSYDCVSTNTTDAAMIVGHCVCVDILYISVCSCKVPGSLGNNSWKSSINFIDRGVLFPCFTHWAPVCWLVIHSWCTNATKYHSSWDDLYWFCLKVKRWRIGCFTWRCHFVFMRIHKGFPVRSPHRFNIKSYPDIRNWYRWRAVSGAKVTQMTWIQQTSVISNWMWSTAKTNSIHLFFFKSSFDT